MPKHAFELLAFAVKSFLQISNVNSINAKQLTFAFAAQCIFRRISRRAESRDREPLCYTWTRRLAPQLSAGSQRLANALPYTPAQLEQWLAALPAQANAQLLVRLVESPTGDWLEAERAFLLNDHWPDQAI